MLRFIKFLGVMMVAVLLQLVILRPAYASYTPLQTQPQDLTQIGSGTVSEILKPDLVRLDNGSVFVLDNIRVHPLYSDAALTWLEQNLLNKKISAHANPALPYPADRLGNRFAHLVLEEGAVWLQGKMVGDGMAWADSAPSNRDLIVPLLQHEDRARTAASGFWAVPGMAVRSADAVGTDRDTFMVVEGLVTETADKRNIQFVNFGDDWKTDFTLTLKRDNLKNFPPAFRVTAFDGKRIRMRGWVSERNGPTMDLTHPEQIEWLTNTVDNAAAPPAPAAALPQQSMTP